MTQFQFETPAPYIPRPYYDGMRGLAGGIFSEPGRGLGALGGPVEDGVTEFRAKYAVLREEVRKALLRYVYAGAESWRISSFENNIATLDRIAAQVDAGNLSKIDQVVRVAGALIDEARAYAEATWWSNLPSVEELVRDIANIPHKFGAAVEDTLFSKTGLWLGLFGLAALYVVSR